jgi:hypothetical protein
LDSVRVGRSDNGSRAIAKQGIRYDLLSVYRILVVNAAQLDAAQQDFV